MGGLSVVRDGGGASGGIGLNQTIPGQSLWYWCGWYTTHKTVYYLKSNHATNNFSGSWMMRKSVLEECAIPNLATVENCPTVPETSCTGKKTCDVRGFALVFHDEMCLIVINNKAGAIVGTVRVNNFYDRPRYYGTCFVVLITVLGLMAVLANVAWQFYKIIISPVSKYREPLRPHRQRDPNSLAEEGVTAGGKPPPLQPLPEAPAGESWLSRFRSKLNRVKQEP
ncbi:hypothetical protein GPECTOR_65g202 [Gonium pectorale]|uniref:Uncharacterized protein n=1 Tax=Gonium pectorale TaxID=33097 RepID=A0A150G429_GONPE|nr:hypothetical protein GPECTOR_65g202 [Gonium pectorale]|eukprot:KXZ44584.1 hypothetical protein GPECTOR_65g202 [Gonium pectorale]